MTNMVKSIRKTKKIKLNFYLISQIIKLAFNMVFSQNMA